MLHLITQSPVELSLFNRIAADDTLLFIRSAVFVVISGHALNEQLNSLLKQNQLCVLTTDLLARGILAEQVLSGIEIIDYAEFVDLTLQHSVVHSWG